MRELEQGEVVIQIWSSEDRLGCQLKPLVERIAGDLSTINGIGAVRGVEGPTPHIPDYFSDLYGSVLGWLIYVAETDPRSLKEFVMAYEEEDGRRYVDIDIFTGYFEKVSRKDIKKTGESPGRKSLI